MVQVDIDITCPNCKAQNTIRFRVPNDHIKQPMEKYHFIGTCKKCNWFLELWFHIFVEMVQASTKKLSEVENE